MEKTTILIKGMHCRSCEILLEENIAEIAGVKKVIASTKNGSADIFSKRPLDGDKISEAVRAAGYEIGERDRKKIINTDKKVYKDLILGLLFLTIIYATFKLFNLRLPVVASSNQSLPIVLLVGLTAGFSTCMALVGGLVLGVSARFAEEHPNAASIQKFRPHLFFNIGRIVSYTVLGGTIGSIGQAVQMSGTMLGLLTIFVGLVMLLMGLQLTELFPKLSNKGITLPKVISQFFKIKARKEKEYSHKNAIVLGALTFFLPCGFTQAMQLYAMSTGSFTRGALIMGIFAIGTAPGLLSIGGITASLKGIYAQRFFRFAGIIVVLLALFNIRNGMNLTGWSTPSVISKTESSTVITDGNVQVVKMDQYATGYSPSTFTVQKDTPVKWVIDSKDASSCASSIYSKKLGIKKQLKSGENIIEFTPKEEGQISFTCSMGMFRGSFTVITKTDNSPSSSVPPVAQADVSVLRDQTPTPNPSPTPVSDAQFINAIYRRRTDIQPTSFTVKAGKPVKFEIDAKEDGAGCMGSIKIPGLVEDPELLEKDNPIVMEFTPITTGKYNITCGMGVPRGTLIVN